MQVHFDNFALNLNLHILNCVYENNFHSKINKNCKNKQFNGCAFENLKIIIVLITITQGGYYTVANLFCFYKP